MKYKMFKADPGRWDDLILGDCIPQCLNCIRMGHDGFGCNCGNPNYVADWMMIQREKEKYKNREIEAAGALIEQDDIKMVVDALRNMNGPKKYYYVETLEKEFAEYHGRKYALMTPNCTTAIHLLLSAIGIKRNNDVMVPDITWIGSSAGITWLGANTVFCDIDAQSWCIDPAKIEHIIKRSGKRIKAIIAVNLYGNMCDWSALNYLSDKYEIPIIEDAAESLGSTMRVWEPDPFKCALMNTKKAGAFGIGSVFSFHRTKLMTTGEGGMLLLDDKELFEKCRLLRDHGRQPTTPAYQNEIVGYKYMPFNVQAALGLSQFRKLKKLVMIKRNQFFKYKQLLGDIPGLQWNFEPFGVYNSAWITTLVFSGESGWTKKKVMEEMNKKGVPIRPFFYPLSSLKAYDSDGSFVSYNKSNQPIAYSVSERGINLPGSLTMTDDQLVRVAHALRKVLLG